MRTAIAVTFAIAACLSAPAASAGASRIGIVAPITGPSEILGKQVLDGAIAAAGDAAIEVADDFCTSTGGADAARRLVDKKVEVVVGFLCTEAIEAALPILTQAGIPVISPGVRTVSLTDRRAKSGFLFYRVAPRADAQQEAIDTILIRRWRDALFAIVDDGTISGRDLSENFRAAAERAALKPVFVDTYRPQSDNQIGLVGRLRKAGANHAFIGGDRDDIAIIARDAAKIGADVTLAAGEALRAAAGEVPLAAGVLMIGLPEWAENADPALIAELATQQIVPEGYVLPSFAAMQIARSAKEIPLSGKPEPAEILTGDFSTAIGTIRFDAKGDLAQNPYRLFRYDGTRFAPVEDD